MSKKVLIIEDHPLVSHAIRQTLASIGFEVLGETSDGVKALRMMDTLQPDIAILDIDIEKLDGVSVLKQIKRDKHATRVIIYTSQTIDSFASRCFQAGASGFVNKSEPISQLVKAVETVAAGYVLFPREAMPFFSNSVGAGETGDLESLTDREMQVLKLLAQGLPNRTIAEKLNLSSKTISGHKINLLMKLSATSVVELANIAKQHKLI
ncbi:response regulator transcription factor [Pseudomonas chlororaphis]|uniref:response regulator transcription factor n=1 Tax=Pseudomonas chlororaphis TaxID=587753 RepID=UPI0030CF5F7F